MAYSAPGQTPGGALLMSYELDQFSDPPSPSGTGALLSDVFERSPCTVDAAYVHVPFCFHKCHYCDFYSIVDTADRQEQFVERIEEELRLVSERIEGSVRTVFIGGGTPTLLRPDLLARLLQSIATHLPLDPDPEWTVEANPETVTEAIADTLVAGGVTRASIGCQSFTSHLLEALERHHEPRNVARSVDRLRRAGITQLSLDLIMGIPGSSFEEWVFDLEQAVSLNPEHLSCYGLQYEPNTPLGARFHRGLVDGVEDALEARMYEHTCDTLAAGGWDQYEISNWARSGGVCLHNLVYWRGGNWLAFGPSASGHLDGTRWRNVPRLASWLEERPWAPVEDLERLDPSTRRGERLMLELRLNAGIPIDRLESWLALEQTSDRRRAIENAQKQGLLEQRAGSMCLTSQGRLLADSLLCQLV